MVAPKPHSNNPRLFIAIEMPDEVIHTITVVQNNLKKMNLFNGSYTHIQGMHVTLKFLGEVPSSVVSSIDNALQQVHHRPLTARLGMVDIFRAGHKIKVIYVHIICPEMAELVTALDSALDPMFAKQERTFIGHVTLARVKHIADIQLFCEMVNNLEVERINFRIDTFTLKQSLLLPEGSEYTTLEKYILS